MWSKIELLEGVWGNRFLSEAMKDINDLAPAEIEELRTSFADAMTRARQVFGSRAFRKFTPPARARSASELDAMWAALADGRIDYVSSDHAPSTREQKLAGSIWDVHFGLPGLDTTFSVLLDGAHRGRISYERVAEAYSEAPARLYGLWPAKGRLTPGADADIVLVDPEERWTVAAGDIRSKAGWSPFEGRTLVGRAVGTFSRGVAVMGAGEVIAEPGHGRFVRRGGEPGV